MPPSTAAAPAALLRRVSLDLTGLPPTPQQLDAFVNDPSGAAYDRIVDELLNSPHYGERMAWPWLEAQHGSFKLAEAAAASMVSGVESSWQLSPCVRLFGELCGMLTEEYSQPVERRVLALLRDGEEGSGGAALVPLSAVASTLLGEGEAGTVAMAQAVAALPRLQLPAERLQAFEDMVAAEEQAAERTRQVEIENLTLAVSSAEKLGLTGDDISAAEELLRQLRAADELDAGSTHLDSQTADAAMHGADLETRHTGSLQVVQDQTQSVALGVGDAFQLVLPANPEDGFKRGEQPEQPGDSQFEDSQDDSKSYGNE